MATPDPALGLSVDFPDQEFRDAIRFAMQMGAVPNPDKRPTVVFKSSGRTYWKNGAEITPPPRLDREGKPLDPEVEVREVEPRREQVDCAIEIEPADAEELPVGNFRQTKAIVTLFDVDYAKVEGCREMLYNGDRYLFGYEPEAMGMFEVGFHVLVFYALDDT